MRVSVACWVAWFGGGVVSVHCDVMGDQDHQIVECVMCGCGDVADWAQLAPMLVWFRCRDCGWDNMVVAS